jgi:FkbM family methyltransferase
VTLGEVFHEHDYAPPPEVLPALSAPRRILDLGANVGLFGTYAAGRWPGAQIDAFEPDPANAAVHRRVIAANDLSAKWRLVEAAAGANHGEARFASGGVALSSLDAHGDLVVEVRDVLEEMAAADLVKMDIEGGEWPILLDPRFATAPPRVLVLEYHPDGGCPGPDPHAAVRAVLNQAGLRTSEIWRREDGYGMLWAWRD